MRYRELLEGFAWMRFRPVPMALSSGNYKARRESDGSPYLLLFGNKIAWFEGYDLKTDSCGWQTRTTNKAINLVRWRYAAVRNALMQRSIFNENTG